MKENIAIVVSQFNHTITDALLDGTLKKLHELGIEKSHVTVIKVPGAIEIPLAAQLLAKKKQHKAIICLGAIIRGETDHYHYVCQQVSQGCQQVMLNHDIPIIFGILTTDNMMQARERIGGKEGHKGMDAAVTALEMIKIVRNLSKNDFSF